MVLIIGTLLVSAGFAYLYTFLFSLAYGYYNWWLLFAWIPLGLLTGILVFCIYAYLFIIIGSHTKPKLRFKHFMLRNLCFVALSFMRIRITHEGYENIPRGKTFVVYANHKSNMDPMLLYYDMKEMVTAVGKKSLFQNHIMKHIGKAYGAIVMDRDNDREAAKTMVKAIKDVKSGQSMIIFPEGGIKTRDVDEMVALRAGAYKLAMKPQALILPVSIVGSSNISKFKRLRHKTVHIIYHKPITPEEYEGKNTTEVGTQVEEIINNGIKNSAKQ